MASERKALEGSDTPGGGRPPRRDNDDRPDRGNRRGGRNDRGRGGEAADKA